MGGGLFEEHDFHDFKISVKHNDPVVMVRAYSCSPRPATGRCLGVTEAGPAFQGTIKSATAFGALLSQGIGDTIRVSLSAPPVEEVKVGIQILQSLNLRPRKLEIVSCPSPGAPRSTSTSWPRRSPPGSTGSRSRCAWPSWAASSTAPGRPAGADLGVASGNGRASLRQGRVVKTVPESKIVGPHRGPCGSPRAWRRRRRLGRISIS